MPTPVWFGVADGKIYLESEIGAGKLKRIQHNPEVWLAPCTLRGRPLGPALRGQARILGPEASEHAERAIADHYGLFRKMFDGAGKLVGANSVKIEVETQVQES
jgi:PPOX class probable F420-dependent enzyme